MSKRARLTDKLIDKVWALYNSNYDSAAIATKLDISQTIDKHLFSACYVSGLRLYGDVLGSTTVHVMKDNFHPNVKTVFHNVENMHFRSDCMWLKK